MPSPFTGEPSSQKTKQTADWNFCSPSRSDPDVNPENNSTVAYAIEKKSYLASLKNKP
jgi:hypothetical protein